MNSIILFKARFVSNFVYDSDRNKNTLKEKKRRNWYQTLQFYSTTGVPKNGVGDCSRSKPTEEPKEAVANWIVVPEEEPCVCALVPSSGATSVAASAGVQHLVGKILSSRPKSRSPGCRVDRVVASEELRVHVVLVSSSLRR